MKAEQDVLSQYLLYMAESNSAILVQSTNQLAEHNFKNAMQNYGANYKLA